MLNIINRFKSLLEDKRISEIITGSSFVLAARIVTMTLAFIFNILVARLYGAEILGIVAVINSFINLAAIFTVLGTDTSILRLIPEHIAKYSLKSAHKVYRKTQFLVLGASLITSVFFFLGSHFIAERVFKKPHLSYYFALASVFIIFQSVMKLNTESIRGLKLIRIFALMQFLPQACNIIFMLLTGLLYTNKDIPVYSILTGFTTTAIIGWFIIEYNFKNKVGKNDYVKILSCNNILKISTPSNSR